MTKRRWLAVGGMPACLLCMGLFASMMIPSSGPGATKANFDLIRMTQAEVEAILGDSDFVMSHASGLATMPVDPLTFEMWRNPDGSAINIVFSGGRLVERKSWTGSKETVIDKFRRWLGCRDEFGGFKLGVTM
jgi:hypothetical protein